MLLDKILLLPAFILYQRRNYYINELTQPLSGPEYSYHYRFSLTDIFSKIFQHIGFETVFSFIALALPKLQNETKKLFLKKKQI